MTALDLKYKDNVELFLREPVNDACDKIISSRSKKILLGGGRGNGKSTVLQHLENISVDGEAKFICMLPESSGWGQLLRDELENEIIYRARYELEVCSLLLFYIKTYFSLTYKKSFKTLELEVNKIREKIRNYRDNDIKALEQIASKKLSSIIIDEIKIEFSNIMLGIDRFDWMNNRHPLAQKIMSEYLESFDKSIITTDDYTLEKIPDEYDFMELNYGKDITCMLEIFEKNIKNLNKNLKKEEKVCEDFITEEICSYLIEQTKGNISAMLSILKHAFDECSFKKADEIDFKYHCNKELKRLKNLDEMGYLPKFYL